MRIPKKSHSKNKLCPCGRVGVYWDKMPVCLRCWEMERRFWGGSGQKEKRTIPLSTYWYQENSESTIYMRKL